MVRLRGGAVFFSGGWNSTIGAAGAWLPVSGAGEAESVASPVSAPVSACPSRPLRTGLAAARLRAAAFFLGFSAGVSSGPVSARAASGPAGASTATSTGDSAALAVFLAAAFLAGALAALFAGAFLAAFFTGRDSASPSGVSGGLLAPGSFSALRSESSGPLVDSSLSSKVSSSCTPSGCHPVDGAGRGVRRTASGRRTTKAFGRRRPSPLSRRMVDPLTPTAVAGLCHVSGAVTFTDQPRRGRVPTGHPPCHPLHPVVPAPVAAARQR